MPFYNLKNIIYYRQLSRDLAEGEEGADQIEFAVTEEVNGWAVWEQSSDGSPDSDVSSWKMISPEHSRAVAIESAVALVRDHVTSGWELQDGPHSEERYLGKDRE